MKSYRITNFNLSLDDFSEDTQIDILKDKLSNFFKFRPKDIHALKILKRSLDARKNKPPCFCYTLCVQISENIEVPKQWQIFEESLQSKPFLPKLSNPPANPPVIVGSGPAGIFAAWRLAQYGLNPLVLERGPEIKERSRRWFQFTRGDKFDEEANLLFGEGGAGTYSDGKLTTRIHDPRVKEVLQIFVELGAPSDILYDAKPHIGSNYLPAMVRRMRQKIMEMGGTFQFQCRFEGIKTSPNALKVQAIQTNQGEIPTDTLILAIGHSARDTLRMLHKAGLSMSAKPFQLGVRVEHPQEMINQAQYGKFWQNPKLPTAEYQLVAKNAYEDLDLYSFCMCPGGEILPATEKMGYFCVNGASKRARNSQFANSGLVITVGPQRFQNDPLMGILFQEGIEKKAFQIAGNNFSAPAQKIEDFLRGKKSKDLLATSYPLPITSVDFHSILPDFICQALKKGLKNLEQKIPGFAGPKGMMLGPEARTCSPLRMDRNPATLMSVNFAGIYPIGEGAGYAGGIMSAAVDGLKCAESILSTV